VARRCSRQVAGRATSGASRARTIRSTRFALRGQLWRVRNSSCRGRVSDAEALRLLLVARRGAVEVRRRALVQLRSVIVTAPDRLRGQLQTLPERRLLERCSHFRRSSSCPVDELAVKLVLPTLARRIQTAQRQKPTRSDPAAQALPRPPPLPTTATHRTADDLTRHRSIIPELAQASGSWVRLGRHDSRQIPDARTFAGEPKQDGLLGSRPGRDRGPHTHSEMAPRDGRSHRGERRHDRRL
jgi:hypothetical protein